MLFRPEGADRSQGQRRLALRADARRRRLHLGRPGRVAGVVVLVGFAALGLWAFRRATLAEFPDAPRTPLNLRGVGWSRSTSEDDRVGQLERLAALRDSGALTKSEYDAEKAALLGSSS